MLQVRFVWTDAYGRTRSQVLTTTATTLADALTNVGTFATLTAAVSDAGLKEVFISSRDNSDAYAFTAGANKDVGATFNATLVDGYDFSLALPMIKAAKLTGGGAVILGDVDIAAWLDQFEAGGVWLLNNRTPSVVSAFNYGQLDE